MSRRRASGRLHNHVRQEAADWLIRFSEGEVDAAARACFHRWLCASPEHVHAYLRVSALWREADHVDRRRAGGDIEALVQLAKREADIVAFDRTSDTHDTPSGAGVPPAERRRPTKFVALAASICLAVGLALSGWYLHSRGSVYVTGIGEQRTVTLPDGSTVVINAGSSLKVAFSETERLVQLREGQALFNVAKNPARPFLVRSAGVTVRAVGTQFDVNHKNSGAVVTVIEGRVQVMSSAPPAVLEPLPGDESADTLTSAATAGNHSRAQVDREMFLGAGEQAWVTPTAARKLALAHVQSATAWTQGLLVFEGAPLSDVVREFNRHNLRQLQVTDEELLQLKVSGTFPAVGAERIVQFMKDRFHVTVAETGDTIRLSAGTPEQ